LQKILTVTKSRRIKREEDLMQDSAMNN